MLNTILSDWPQYSEEEGEAVKQVLLSNRVNFWTGHRIREFEKNYADLVGVKYGIALSNGTVALEMALRAIGICPGDEVIVTPRSFIASASSVVNAGATPVFADVDANSQNLSADTVAPLIGDKTKAVIVVHVAGMPADMAPLCTLARSKNIKIIEDCAQAHGAMYRGLSVGSIGDIGVWSFCQDKIITTAGEGGMVTTNNKDYMESIWSLKDHGKSPRARSEARVFGKGYRWLHDDFGSNARMTEIQAAIGLIQIKKLPDWRSRRNANALMLASVCKKYDWLRVPETPKDCVHAYYRFYVFTVPQKLPSNWSRENIIDELNSRRIPAFTGVCPEIYKEKAFVKAGLGPEAPLLVAKSLGETSIMFLVHPTISDEEMSVVCNALEDVNEKIQENASITLA